MKSRPFPFDALEKRSRTSVEASNQLLDLFFFRGIELQLVLSEVLRELCGEECWIQTTYVGPLRDSRVVQDTSFGWWGLLKFGDRAGALWLDPFCVDVLKSEPAGIVPRALRKLAQKGVVPPSFTEDPIRAASIRNARMGAHLEIRGVVGREQEVGSFELYVPGADLGFVDSPLSEEVMRSVKLTCPVDAAWVQIDPKELSHLGPRDVLFMDAHAFSEASTIVVPAKLGLARDCWLDADLSTDHENWRIKVTMEEDVTINAASNANSPDLTKRARVDVSIRLGTLELSMRELAMLQPGKVLELSSAVGDPVEVVAGGRVMATGELINVDGRVGVQILRLTR